jgi:very-short-patch-repair endonuclease
MSAKKTTAQFIEDAVKVHGERYDYSLVEYVNSAKKVKIICKEHGVFEQEAAQHIKGISCAACSGNLKLNTGSFILKANKVHKGIFDYSLVEYKTGGSRVKIICKIHGVFEQKAASHLNGVGCKGCYNQRRGQSQKSTNNEFIERAINIHNDKYEYSNVIYTTANTKVEIICKQHGPFMQVASSHLAGKGCSKCAGCYNPTTQEFIEKADEIHKGKFDYSNVIYTKSDAVINIICKKHGLFKSQATRHLTLKGGGCGKCGREIISSSLSYNTSEFRKLANSIHGDKYDYSLVEYVNSAKKVKIICKEHGPFKQTPNNHLNGAGCPKCRASKGEFRIEKHLKTTDLFFESEKRFDNCRNKMRLPFDFYVPSHNLLVEYDGKQHFIPVKGWGGLKNLEAIQKRDAIKTRFAERHNIRLLRIKYTEYDRIEEILSEALKLEYQSLQLSLFAA